MERIPDSPDEADLPAQEAPSRQGARLPRPDEDHRGPPRPRRTAGSRSEAADGLTTGRGTRPAAARDALPPAGLRGDPGSRDDQVPPPLLRPVPADRPRDDAFRPLDRRRLGGAVVRNRVRRRLREALRVMAPSFQPGWDVLIIARPAIVEADHDTLVGALQPDTRPRRRDRRTQVDEADRDRAHQALPHRVRLAAVLVPLSSRPARTTPSRRSRSTVCCKGAGWVPSASPAAIPGAGVAMTRSASEAPRS